jgi:Xaa-Pro aminopeptidase
MTTAIDHARLRADRRARTLDAMGEHDLDVLVLGREANARFASGARRLWTAGTRPFAPGCVVVRSTRQVHVLSTWDDGMPPEIDHEHLYGTTWNPAILTHEVGAIPGLAAATRIGVDGMTARAHALLTTVAPHAQLVDASPAMLTARRRKSADEVACIAHAVAVAEAGVAAALDAATRGVTERELSGRYLEAMARLGVTTPLTEGTINGRIPTDRRVDAGAPVTFEGGAVYEGYAGVIGGTRDTKPDGDGDRSTDAWQRLMAALHPGGTGADVAAAHPEASARSIGLGLEPPISDADVLEADMTLVITTRTRSETVRITANGDGPELLSRRNR